MRDWPWTLIKTSGEDVGLPEGTMGNSEVGHQNIGAGRVVQQESLVMTRACRAGLHTNPAIAGAIVHAKARGSALHLMGINSDAGVHGLLEHLAAILTAAARLGMPADRVFIHLFTDGRDAGPFTGLGYAAQVEGMCRSAGVGRIASVMGRYYAMDRDHRWERVRLAYNCLTGGTGLRSVSGAPCPPHSAGDPGSNPGFKPGPQDAAAAIQHYYDHPSGDTLKGDEFITPVAIGSPSQVAASRIKPGDAVIFYNYRGDRPRELSAAFVFPTRFAKVKPSPGTGAVGFDRALGLTCTL